MAIRFTLRQLEYFVAVGDEGSIVNASKKVNISSPSISAAVAQLEAEFGLSLFVRKHTYGLTLTPAGREFMVQAQRVLKEAAAMNRLAGELSGKVQGSLRVGCLLTFAQIIMPSLRRDFEDRYPEVKISQVELNQTSIFEQLRSAQIDVALSYDLDIPSDILFIPLVELPPYALLGETHPLAHQAAVSLADLQKMPMVLLDLPHSSAYFLSLFDTCGLSPVIAERTKDMAVMCGLVANGFGYSIANIRPLRNMAPDGKPLQFLPIKEPAKPMKLGLAMVDDVVSGLTVQTFVEHCHRYIPELTPFKQNAPTR